MLQVTSDTALHLRPPHSCNLIRCHTESLAASNVSHNAPDRWNQAHPQAAHRTAANAVITAYLKTTSWSSDFWRRTNGTIKWTVTPFTNTATDHNRLRKAAEISLLIPRKLLHPYCPPPPGGIQNYQTYLTIPSRTTSEQQTCDRIATKFAP